MCGPWEKLLLALSFRKVDVILPMQPRLAVNS